MRVLVGRLDQEARLACFQTAVKRPVPHGSGLLVSQGARLRTWARIRPVWRALELAQVVQQTGPGRLEGGS
ncbi:MAG: hypothetical protein AB1758_26850 [Candidatus Eremiobacterota bacterium]